MLLSEHLHFPAEERRHYLTVSVVKSLTAREGNDTKSASINDANNDIISKPERQKASVSGGGGGEGDKALADREQLSKAHKVTYLSFCLFVSLFSLCLSLSLAIYPSNYLVIFLSLFLWWGGEKTLADREQL